MILLHGINNNILITHIYYLGVYRDYAKMRALQMQKYKFWVETKPGKNWKTVVHVYPSTLGLKKNFWLGQPKTSIFPAHALIWVHLKTVHWFSQPTFSLFPHLKIALHNLVLELWSEPKISKISHGYLLKSRVFL